MDFVQVWAPTQFARFPGRALVIYSVLHKLKESNMSKPIHPTALFRLMVLGPLASRTDVKRGEIKAIVRELASKPYDIPNSHRAYLSIDTIMRWYHAWRRGGIDALNPAKRADKGSTHLSTEVQAKILQLKQDNPSRSINTLITMTEQSGLVSNGQLSRSSVHRFLQQLKLSKRVLQSNSTIERRAFVANHAGDLWQGDVLHGPSIQTESGMRKTYLVSFLDDATRLIIHSAFCLSETALDVEGVLKQAILKRGMPNKLLIDNGAAYRAQSLQTICAYLDIRLIYCKPYEPEAKGKLERFHRTFREQFLNELDSNAIRNLDDLNARLWAWCESVYHTRPHAGLNGQTPLERWRQELIHVRPLSQYLCEHLDDIFCHRVKRQVKKDGTVSWNGILFEVSHTLVDEVITLVVDPHAQTVIRAESAFGDNLGPLAVLNRRANSNRTRQRPHAPPTQLPQSKYAVESTYQDYIKKLALTNNHQEK
jgi:putative transposase